MRSIFRVLTQIAAIQILLFVGPVTVKSFAQPDSQGISQLLASYKEEIVLHHDGPIYLTGDYLRFSLACIDGSTGLLSPLSRVAYVELLDGENEPAAQLIVELKAGKGEGDILLPFTMNSGNYVVRAYTRWMRNFAPENYSHAQVTVVNPFKPLPVKTDKSTAPPFASGTVPITGLTALTDKVAYSTREKVVLDLNLPEAGGVVSVSVSKVPDFYVSLPQPPASLTIEDQAFRPEQVFLPEINGQLVEGTVRNPATDLPQADALVYLSVPGKIPGFYTSRSDQEGKVRFEVLDFYGQGEIHLKSAGEDQSLAIELESSFSKEFAKLQLNPLSIDENWAAYLTKGSQNMQIRNVYTDTLPAFREVHTTDTLPFYGLPDQRYFLDDYTRFPLTEEVLREYVSGIMLRKRDGKFYFKMVDVENQEIMEQDPLILYDGLPVTDADKIVEIDPRLIKRIDVMTRKVYMGEAVFHGVTSFHTYDGDLKGLAKAETGEAQPFEGLQVKHRYVRPAYETKEQQESMLPDFRSTLCWVPWLQMNPGLSKVEFYTGDDTGTYLVSIRGISHSGKIIETSSYLKVEQ